MWPNSFSEDTRRLSLLLLKTLLLCVLSDFLLRATEELSCCSLCALLTLSRFSLCALLTLSGSIASLLGRQALCLRATTFSAPFSLRAKFFAAPNSSLVRAAVFPLSRATNPFLRAATVSLCATGFFFPLNEILSSREDCLSVRNEVLCSNNDCLSMRTNFSPPRHVVLPSSNDYLSVLDVFPSERDKISLRAATFLFCATKLFLWAATFSPCATTSLLSATNFSFARNDFPSVRGRPLLLARQLSLCAAKVLSRDKLPSFYARQLLLSVLLELPCAVNFSHSCCSFASSEQQLPFCLASELL